MVFVISVELKKRKAARQTSSRPYEPVLFLKSFFVNADFQRLCLNIMLKECNFDSWKANVLVEENEDGMRIGI